MFSPPAAPRRSPRPMRRTWAAITLVARVMPERSQLNSPVAVGCWHCCSAMWRCRVTAQGYMPPYHVVHDGSCGQFQDGDAVTPAQIATLGAWATGDKALGTEVALVEPRPPALTGGTDYVTPTFTPMLQRGTMDEADEYRCFAVATSLPRDSFI